ncbi:MAG: Bifunctional purine biosynthesis protein PurH [Alphaproteobacteria bacterium MarineAlpha5_Bin11]|nr:bifunctional phosphoribosylaminoimidazolecarboxamide formyltransferase/IMP cyclohydrolase PurH [Pelagibacteraceae bacterium]PPR44442.1 MAG: Bifunctional purine biosynthesis protein PurH [Alphaproteobacteria bacterium MarineAlpha5_Bin11]PPR51880.1 MAG: Bifunctional purine biosynthesis protein PurH [Alphaproteobacteria bacterium MarineAlpha5_Bin10]|tara:strand:- start:9777 stop:11279 length:1503 start_codon:yes stop_codon:yes gene_type:complete
MNKKALISVSNKNKLHILCKVLRRYKIDIIATGSTHKKINELGYNSTIISDVTKFDEILDGRVKTLHPKIHGGILFKRDNKNHLNIVGKKKIPHIDYVIIDLYPFSKFVSSGKLFDECIENIDIGGHSIIRSAIKNFKFVTVISDISDYILLKNELIKNNGHTGYIFRKNLAKKALGFLNKYDSSVREWFGEEENKIQLRYGENPHQTASLVLDKEIKNPLGCKQMHGKQLSYNNIIDVNAALSCLAEFKKPTAVIVKHTNPCGASTQGNINLAIKKALESDLQSAFGGIIAVNRKIDEKILGLLKKKYFEAIIAPDFSKKILLKLKNKKELILLKSNKINKKNDSLGEIKRIKGGYLEQDEDNVVLKKQILKVVTRSQADKKTINDMIFAFSICKHIKSNAIVLAKNSQVIGIGAGQMSRLDSIEIALKKLSKNFGKLNNFVLASDGFLPFKDNIEILNYKKCKAIIQPGGSKKDHEVIAKANELKISMYFTGIRHFRH